MCLLYGVIASYQPGKADYCNSQDSKDLDNALERPWSVAGLDKKTSDRRKDKSREKKEKWVFKRTQTKRFNGLVKMCGETLGVVNTLEAFSTLGRRTGKKEYIALLESCMDDSRKTDDPEVQLHQNVKAYSIFQSMKENGFPIEEEIYGPFLKHLIDADMVQEFSFFSDIFIDENPASMPRLAYYEMLLCIRVNDKDKIQQLLDDYSVYDGGDKHSFQESYLLALCESDCRRDLLMLLETFDVTKSSSEERLSDIFKSLGMFSLAAFAKKFLLELKTSGAESATLTSYIFDYSISIPHSADEDAVSKFKQLHSEMEMKPTFTHYEKLIIHLCKLLKVHEAIGLADEMFNLGATSSLETIHAMLDACMASYEYNMVHRIYSMIHRQGLKPNDQTYNSLIALFVRMKDYRGAYDIIRDMAVFDLQPTSNIFNTIIAGYFHEKNMHGVKRVLKQMEQENVKPNSRTYSYLISNCNSEKEIIKNLEEMKGSEVQITKPVYMALIDAYAACGEFEKAKQIILDDKIHEKNLYVNELRSALVASLASHGRLFDALTMYGKIKQDDCSLEPKAAMTLIDNLESEGQLDLLFQLLEELKDTDYLIQGYYRALRYCIRHNRLSCAIDFLKTIRDKVADDEVATESIFDEVFFIFVDQEPKDMKFGLELLRAIKEEMGLRPSRKVLDFLLDACVCANDLETAYLIWKEYQTAGLPYNILSFLRMYRTLLALGDLKYAEEIVKNIPQDDPDIAYVSKSFKVTYSKLCSPHKDQIERKERKKA